MFFISTTTPPPLKCRGHSLLDDLLSLICNCSTDSDMAFELVNTIDRAWRTVEDTDFLACKTVILYYEDLYS